MNNFFRHFVMSTAPAAWKTLRLLYTGVLLKIDNWNDKYPKNEAHFVSDVEVRSRWILSQNFETAGTNGFNTDVN
jgi:hypothetical protein